MRAEDKKIKHVIIIIIRKMGGSLVYKMYMERLWFGKPDTKSEFNKSVGQREAEILFLS
jgi:hypothetical protein